MYARNEPTLRVLTLAACMAVWCGVAVVFFSSVGCTGETPDNAVARYDAGRPSGPSAAMVAADPAHLDPVEGRAIEAPVAEVIARADELPGLMAVPSAPAPAPEPEPLALAHSDDDLDTDHFASAEHAMSLGNAKAALEHYRKAAHDFGDYDSYMGIAEAAKQAGDRDRAIEAFEVAANLDDEMAEPLIQAARLCLGKKQIQKGLRYIDRALSREAERADALNTRGRLYMAVEQYDQAIIAFERAMDVDPSYVWAYNNAGYVHLLTGRYKSAIEVLEIATLLTPVKAYMFNNLGLAYEKNGQILEAREAFDQALHLRPGYVNATINLKRVDTRLAMAPAEEAADDGASMSDVAF